MTRVSYSNNIWCVDIYCHGEMFNEELNYRSLVELLLSKIASSNPALVRIHDDDIDDWDSMKTIEIALNEYCYKIYWEREIGFIAAYCDSEDAATTLGRMLDSIWPETTKVPFVL
jgi:hypothetical protein